MLRAAVAGEPPIDHDGKLGAERLALLHAVRREHHRAALGHDVQDARPQEPPSLGVHAARRLILNDKRTPVVLNICIYLVSTTF